MKKLGYRKSHNGCTRCKQRRVKCDEKRPCGACSTHSVPCSLVGDCRELDTWGTRCRNGSTSTRSVAKTCATFDLRRSSENCTLTSSTTRASDYCSTAPSQRHPSQAFPRTILHQGPAYGSESDWILDLEFLHHYTAVTYKSFLMPPEAHDYFRLEVPRVAFSHSCLLHQILSLSALHLGHLRPGHRQEYVMRATWHQNKSIGQIRTSLASGITQENCEALFISSAMLMASAFASYCYRFAENADDALDEAINIFYLIRGMQSIKAMSAAYLRNPSNGGPFERLRKPVGEMRFLHQIIDELNCVLAEISSDESVDNRTRNTLQEAIASLLSCLSPAHLHLQDVVVVERRTIIFWPMSLSNEFLMILGQKQPTSMAIFVYYSLVVKRVEADIWFLSGWCQKAAKCVSTLLGDTARMSRSPWAAQQMAEIVAN